MKNLRLNPLITATLATLFFSSTTTAQSLSEAVAQVLQQHPDIYRSVQEVESRDFEKKAAAAAYRPTVEIGLAAGHQRYKSPTLGNQRSDLNTAGAVLSVSQMLFDGRATKNEVARQKLRVESAQYEAISTSENLGLRATEVYLEVLKHHEITALAQQSLELHRQIRSQMQARISAGIASEGDLAQVKAREALANSNFIAARSALLNAETNYLAIVGSYPIASSMSRPRGAQEFFSDDVHKEVQSALENHPTLKAATSDVGTAQAQYSAAKSRFMPRINLEASHGYDKNSNGIEGDFEDTQINLRVSYDLYQGGEHSYRKKYAAKQIEVAKGVRDSTHLQVIESMRLSFNAYTTLSQREAYLIAHKQHALISRDAYRQQFKLGKRTLLDVLNTENEYVNAAQALVTAQYDKLYSSYRIVNAKGMMLSSLEFNTESLFLK